MLAAALLRIPSPLLPLSCVDVTRVSSPSYCCCSGELTHTLCELSRCASWFRRRAAEARGRRQERAAAAMRVPLLLHRSTAAAASCKATRDTQPTSPHATLATPRKLNNAANHGRFRRVLSPEIACALPLAGWLSLGAVETSQRLKKLSRARAEKRQAKGRGEYNSRRRQSGRKFDSIYLLSFVECWWGRELLRARPRLSRRLPSSAGAGHTHTHTRMQY